MPQFFVFASGAGARIRALGYPPRKALRAGGRPCEPCGLGLALSTGNSAHSHTGGVA